ncbi:aminodeoxychorismate lyase [Okibacterium endophyticum]
MSIVYLIDPLAAHRHVSRDEMESRLRRIDPDQPALSVFDNGPARGDGVFETLGVIDGRARGVEAHLARLAQSAAKLDLDEPHLDQWRHAVSEAENAFAASSPATAQASMRLVITRGVDGAGANTCWLTVTAARSDFPERRTGIRVVTLDRGMRSDVAETAPWLLTGAKTLSYAVNMAVLREARRLGADDAVLVSTDGFVLEGPTSSVIARFGQRLVTPGTDLGILAGTTQRALFGVAARLGYETAYEALAIEKLREADAIWLVSSVRLAAPVTQLDDTPVAVDSELTASLNEGLLREP